LATHQQSLEERLAALAAVEGKLEAAIAHERQDRESRLSVVAKSLEELENGIRAQSHWRKEGEEALYKSLEAATQQAEEERRKLEEDLARYRVVEYAALAERLREDEQNRVAETERIHTFCRSLQEALERTSQSFQETCAATSAANDRKREDDIGEMKRMHAAYAEEQRKWVNDLIEHQDKASKAASEVLILEVRSRGEELGREAAERVRIDVMAEVTRIEASAAELVISQNEKRKSDLAVQEAHAQKTANELKECLTSHSEFMEALASEQQLLIKRLNEGFALEDRKREDLTVRVHRLETDMQKVKGHLPILFMPTGFPQN
jgi:hypothetical protein